MGSTRMIGRVRSWEEARGFGFLVVQDHPRLIFCHARDVEGGRHIAPQVHDVIEFELVDAPLGPKAVRGRIVKRAAEAARR
jgi:cold shock CspA family protein